MVQTLPLFPAPPRVIPVKVVVRPVNYGWCPNCRGSGRRTGLLRQGKHLVWREHRYTTWTGARITCRSSGVLLCQCAARVVPGWKAPDCTCTDG